MTSTDLDLSHPRDLNGASAPAGALAIQPGQNTWDGMQTAALAQLGLADAGDGDRAVFLHVCQRTGLDPFARQIYMIGRNEKKNERRNGQWTETWTVKWTIQTGIEGWRVVRDRAERRAGVRGTLSRAVWYDHDGGEHKVWVQPKPPAACELTYTVRDRDGGETPYTSVLRYDEYVQLKDGRPIAQWVTKPSHMLEKCTEADVYRKAFPQDFSGIHLDDAMPPAGQPLDQEPPPVPRGRVTAGEIITGDPEPPQDSPPPPCEDDDHPGPARATPARATAGQLAILGQRLGKLDVDDDNRLTVLEKLADRDLTEPAQLTRDEATHIRGLLDRCGGDRGALVELLATGQLPETGGGDA